MTAEYLTILGSLIFQIVLLVFALLIYKKFILKNIYINSQQISKLIYGLLFIVVFVFDFYLSTLFYNTDQSERKLNLLQNTVPIFIIFILISIIILLMRDISKKQQQQKADLLEKQLTSQLLHYGNLKQLNDDFRSFKHDYKNNLHCIRALISDGNITDALDYMNKLELDSVIEHNAYDTGNRVADAILTAKLLSVQNNGINLTIDCIISDLLEPIDLCVILSNALDNAIEACQQVKINKYINVKATIQQGYQYLEITNSYASSQTDNNFTTTKTDKLNHGFGLHNIKKTVQKYDGNMTIKNDNSVFSLIITMKL